MSEIPIRVTLSVNESTQQFNLSSSESRQQFNLSPNEAIVGERDYNHLVNKPSIDRVTLQDDITLQQLGLQHIYYNTKAYWDSQNQLVSEYGAVYIYKDYSVLNNGNKIETAPALKIGDGTSYLIDMPILNGDVANMLLDHIQNAIVHVSNEDRSFWNNKSSAYIDSNTDQETLVLSNTSFMIGGNIYNHG